MKNISSSVVSFVEEKNTTVVNNFCLVVVNAKQRYCYHRVLTGTTQIL